LAANCHENIYIHIVIYQRWE